MLLQVLIKQPIGSQADTEDWPASHVHSAGGVKRMVYCRNHQGATDTNRPQRNLFRQPLFFLSVGGRCHKCSAGQSKYTVVFLCAGTNVVTEAVFKPDKIMNEILKSPKLLPPLTPFEKNIKKKNQNNETLLLVALAAAVSPFSHLLFHHLSLVSPPLTFCRAFYVIYMSSPRPVRSSLRWERSPETLWWQCVCICVCVCDPHQSTLTQWDLCACTRFITPPLVTSLLSFYIIALLCSQCQPCQQSHENTHQTLLLSLGVHTLPSLASFTFD